MPLDNTDAIWLIKSIESVLNQRYARWELYLTGIVSTARHIRPILERYAQQDQRITFVLLEQNRSISAANNVALTLAKGEFVALLESDAELAPTAFYEVATYLRAHPKADFIYTDVDQITQAGDRQNPFFKPDWSPDYFHSYMYTLHLSVYRTSLVRKIKGFRSEYEGAQYWDLALRISEQTSQIHHVPKVLYHRRTLPSSLSSGVDANLRASRAAQRALQDMLDRSPYPGWVEKGAKSGLFRVRRHIQRRPLVSIVIPSAGTHLKIRGQQVCLLAQCVSSIRRLSTYQNLEIILVDGYDISKATLKLVQGADLKLVRSDQPFNFSQRMNLAAQSANGEILLMLNDDTEIMTSNWIEAMLELAQQTEIGAVGAKLFYPNGRLQHAGMLILTGKPGHAFHNGSGNHDGYYYSNIVNRDYLGVTGACMMMRHRLFEELNGFDESFPLSYNDVDLCLRAHQAGYRNVFTPYAELIHYESVSRANGLSPGIPGELERLHEKFAGSCYLQNDPYYNPNLSSRRPFFQLAWPDGRNQQRGSR
ncbi:glycosyltransferase family 2 protein [Leptolyngbya sp. BC1307]|uniref:glycosyltransferase family 2 protein n=1 Tax=Leptolyngbya sp. BC1307 TaxID=2029589 RepID=UPI0014835551|nr:glycosyltransferase family 2 protein [Leptolyngbya sp. BC1307]